jgi:hypothetical protein
MLATAIFGVLFIFNVEIGNTQQHRPEELQQQSPSSSFFNQCHKNRFCLLLFGS